jgi:5-methylcytosine-specific restriction endonuclease McrA
MICWYQPTEVMNQKRLIHLCSNNPKETYCGLKINSKWILWEKEDIKTTCTKCFNSLKNKEGED